jgi:hypothetical protein
MANVSADAASDMMPNHGTIRAFCIGGCLDSSSWIHEKKSSFERGPGEGKHPLGQKFLITFSDIVDHNTREDRRTGSARDRESDGGRVDAYLMIVEDRMRAEGSPNP